MAETTGGSVFGFLKKKKKKEKAIETHAPTEQSTDQTQWVTAHDAQGNEVKISHTEWRTRVLPHNLQENWNDPDALYRIILSAVDDGFAKDVVEAAAHLRAIDPIAERGVTMQGIVYLRVEEYVRAQTVLEQGIEALGESEVLLTNLAKAYDYQGLHARAEEILWRALEHNPNFDNAVAWYASIQRERGGEKAYLHALERIAAIPGSWLPDLWLAKAHLQAGDAERALATYADLVRQEDLTGEALMMISGDLGQCGYVEKIPQLLAPIYYPEQHGIYPGFNLLEAYIQLEDKMAAEALLRKLRALDVPPVRQHVDAYEARVTAL